jgi:glyoxylate reductase
VRVVVTHALPGPAVELLREAGHDVVVGPSESAYARAELHELVRGADGILAHLVDPVDDGLLDAAGPQLKVVANYAAGYDNVDLEAAARHGVKIANTPGVLTEAVAEHVFALLLALARRVVDADAYVRSGAWGGWAMSPYGGGSELRGKALGVVGAGRIGSRVAEIGRRGLGMAVCYTARSAKPELERTLEARRLPLDELLREADAVVLLLPLTDETDGLIGAGEPALMNATALLVNVSRGRIVRESELVEALRAGEIAGAALDVFEDEPRLTPGLAELPNVVLTPHIASATAETRTAMSRLAAENVLAALAGQRLPSEVDIDSVR